MITYAFEVIEVRKDANCMLVRYMAEGYTEYTIGTRMPFSTESVQNIIQEYAPISLWLQEKQEIADVEVGLCGTIDLTQPNPLENVESEIFLSQEEQTAAAEEFQRELIREVVLEVINEKY